MGDTYKTIEYVAVRCLQYDPENPRLPHNIPGGDEQAVIEYMLRDATIIELIGSIAQTGFFPGEPLLVARTGTPNVYHVVEGNRRLTAVKLLLEPGLAPIKKKAVQAAIEGAKHRPDKLPVVIYDDRQEILDYLGFRHITGVKEWDPLEKARYLRQLVGAGGRPQSDDELESAYRAAARTIGSRADYVARLLGGLTVYEAIADADFFALPGVGPDQIGFAVLTTALSYADIAGYVGITDRKRVDAETLNRANLANLVSWMFQPLSEGKTRLGESRRLAQLSRVIAHDTARNAFADGMPLLDAERLTHTPGEVYRNAISASHERLKEARDNVHLVTDVNEGDLAVIGNIAAMSRGLRAQLEDSLEGARVR